jgi:GH18 family chitinase
MSRLWQKPADIGCEPDGRDPGAAGGICGGEDHVAVGGDQFADIHRWRGWTGVASANHGLYQPSTGPAPGTWEDGADDYKAVKQRLGTGFTRYEDAVAGAAWLFDGNTFWTLDDPPVMNANAAYVQKHKLGGIMFWELSGDTPDGELINAIAGGLSA